jgi:hypothetical protein
MNSRMMYVELKTGYSDDGPAWIGKAFFSKTGKSVYFDGLSFSKHSGYGGNHCEVLSGDYYWISGIKKKGTNRHWAGNGKIKIDKGVVEEYLEMTKLSELPKNRFEIVELNNDQPIQEFNAIENKKIN